jgi:hypothetical protein
VFVRSRLRCRPQSSAAEKQTSESGTTSIDDDNSTSTRDTYRRKGPITSTYTIQLESYKGDEHNAKHISKRQKSNRRLQRRTVGRNAINPIGTLPTYIFHCIQCSFTKTHSTSGLGSVAEWDDYLQGRLSGQPHQLNATRRITLPDVYSWRGTSMLQMTESVPEVVFCSQSYTTHPEAEAVVLCCGVGQGSVERRCG